MRNGNESGMANGRGPTTFVRPRGVTWQPPHSIRRTVREFLRFVIVLFGLAVLPLAYGYGEATRPPRIVLYDVRSPAWTTSPLGIALLSDTHAVLPDMPPSRVERVCDQASALAPDIVVLAGDYIGRTRARTGAVSPEDAVAPFARCHARLGVYAVLGNHDMRLPGDAARIAAGLRAAGVVVLRNAAVRVDGLWIAGTDDGDYGKADLASALAAVPPAAPLLFVAHNPDVFAAVPARVALMLAGHTHGGQVAPFGHALTLPIVHTAWARGVIADHGGLMVVTSGVGASGVPIRIGVPPEIALITLSGPAPAYSVGRKSGTER